MPAERTLQYQQVFSIWRKPGTNLTKPDLPDIMSDMKNVNAREFQKAFSKVAEELQEGQTIAVTKRGKPLGFFTKAPAGQRVAMPDFAGNLQSVPYSTDAAERFIREITDEPLS